MSSTTRSGSQLDVARTSDRRESRHRLFPFDSEMHGMTSLDPASAGATPNSGDTSAPSVSRKPARRKPRFPPLWVWFIVGLCLALIVWIRTRDDIGDRAIVNVLTFAFTFLASVSVGLWFLLFSGFRRRTRWTALAVGVIGIVILGSLVRIDGVNGEMRPRFRWRWTPRPDQTLTRVASESSAVDLRTTTPHDVPQFLGPSRHPWLPGPRLASDWSARSPRLVWKQPIGAGWSAFSAVNGYAVTMEQRGDEELVTCYAIDSGKLQWAHAITARHETVLGGIGPRSTPTIHEGRVFALGATGVLRCLDGAGGSELWRDDVRKRYGLSDAEEPQRIAWGRAGSPLVVDDLIVIPAGGSSNHRASLVAYRQDSGELVWESGDQQVSYSSPVLTTLAGKRQIVSVNEDLVTGHEPATGEVLWKYPWPGNSAANASASQAVPVGEDKLFLSKGYGVGAALIQLASQGPKWEASQVWAETGILKTKFTNVVLFEGYVYGLSDGVLECVNVLTGKRQWKKGRYGHGQILGVAERLLVMAEDGTVWMLEASPKAHRELAHFPALEGQTWNNLCLYGNRLLVRNAQEAACYELAVEPATEEPATEETHTSTGG